MKKSLKNALLASSVLALAYANHGVANAAVKDGFYLTPNAEVIFVDKSFTKENGIGIGGGGGLALGYQVKNFLIDLSANYQYYGGKGSSNQKTNAFAESAPLTAGATLTTTADSKESFIPVTLGLKYLIPVMAGGKLSITPGIAGGVWFHSIKRDLSYSSDNQALAGVLATPAAAALLPSTDNGDETKGVVVPSISLDYAPLQNLTISLAGKFYIVPEGYSDAYNADNQAAATKAAAANTPAYDETKKSFWYGGVNLGVQYTF